MNPHYLWFPALLGLSFSLTVAADIYRCEVDNVIVFSDTACQAGAQPYASKGQMSVVEVPESLEHTAELNRQFVQQRLDRQSAERQARAARPQTAPIMPAQAQGQPPARVIVLPPYYQHDHYPGGPPPGRGRPDRRPVEDEEPGQQKFSALSGPFPGTRRRDRQ
jgi:hypothetical protein